MQIQKEELREDILRVAEKEFMKKGFGGASMRTIAQKANTTLGNLYNYFESKERILDAIIGEIPSKIDDMLKKHRQRNAEKMKLEQVDLEEEMKKIFPEEFYLQELLNPPFVILMEGCKGTKYEAYRERFCEIIAFHAKEHIYQFLHKENIDFLAKAMSQSFLSAILFIAKNKSSAEEGKSQLMDYIQMLIMGVAGEAVIKGKKKEEK